MKIVQRHLVSIIRNISCQFDRPRPPFYRDKIGKIKRERAPSSVETVKLIGRIVSPAHRQKRQNHEKARKWPDNDQFRQFNFLIKRFYRLSYISFEAELQMGFFEITSRSLGCSVIE